MPAVDDASRVAAFFDLDKTVIAKASMVAFSRPLHRAGMLTRRLMVKAAWGQLVYAQIGASPEKLERLRESVLQLTKGWDQAEVSAIVRDTIGDVIEPIVYDEALDRIRAHQRWGHKVFIVSASPEEVVAPIAQLIGVDEAIATRAELDEHGRYSGRTERYVYAEEKVAAITEVAERDGLDLDHCWAYSDSATDIPMLAAVGHPVAVNPDRELSARPGNEGGRWSSSAWRSRCVSGCPCPHRSTPRWGAARPPRSPWRLVCGGGGAGAERLQLPNLLGRDRGQRNEDDEDEQLLHADRVVLRGGAARRSRERAAPGWAKPGAEEGRPATPRAGRERRCRCWDGAASTSHAPRSGGCAPE